MKTLGNIGVLIVILLFSVKCFSVDSNKEASEIIKNIEGVYKHRFMNGLVSGEEYESEDVIEIVSYSPSSIYFRAVLKFSNAHSCGIYGIADYHNQSFSYKRSFGENPSEICVLNISVDAQKIKISDLDGNNKSTCTKYYCGARGSLDGYEISMEEKRKIRYMPIILKSREYASAVEEYNKKK